MTQTSRHGAGRIARTLAGAAAGAGLLVTAGLVAAPGAAADDFTCRTSVGAARLDNVKVPAGATCRLTGTKVKGTIKVERGATLVASGVVVDGNIQSQGHRSVTVTGSYVDGSIQLESGGALSLTRNRVNGDIQLFSNYYGTKMVSGNVVGGNLQCKSNTPPPTGGNNLVDGNKEDQCRWL